MSALLGKKIGMTRVFDETGNSFPVTVVQAGPCYVTQIKTVERDGYAALQIGFDVKKEKNTTRPMLGHLKKADVPPVYKVCEFPMPRDKEFKLGDVLTVEEFKPGDSVAVAGLSKGKGFAGVVKRHKFKGGPLTHGQSDRLRAPGSIGQSSYPSKVFKGTRMAGRMGNRRVKVAGLRVMKVDAEQNLIFIKGAVPGARNNYLEIYLEK